MIVSSGEVEQQPKAGFIPRLPLFVGGGDKALGIDVATLSLLAREGGQGCAVRSNSLGIVDSLLGTNHTSPLLHSCTRHEAVSMRSDDLASLRHAHEV